MEKKIILSKRFIRKSNLIYEYLKYEWSYRVADEFLDKLKKKIDYVCLHPENGMPSSKIKGVRSVLLKPHNRIYYKAFENRIEFSNILDMRINPAKNRYK